MSRYVATNIRLSADRHRRLKNLAAREEKSCAQIVREAIDARLGLAEPGPAPGFGDDPFDKLVGSFESDRGDESVNHDHFLYGWPREKDAAPVRRHRGVAGARRQAR